MMKYEVLEGYDSLTHYLAEKLLTNEGAEIYYNSQEEELCYEEERLLQEALNKFLEKLEELKRETV